jgi:hypothetical protein
MHHLLLGGVILLGIVSRSTHAFELLSSTIHRFIAERR